MSEVLQKVERERCTSLETLAQARKVTSKYNTAISNIEKACASKLNEFEKQATHKLMKREAQVSKLGFLRRNASELQLAAALVHASNEKNRESYFMSPIKAQVNQMLPSVKAKQAFTTIVRVQATQSVILKTKPTETSQLTLPPIKQQRQYSARKARDDS